MVHVVRYIGHSIHERDGFIVIFKHITFFNADMVTIAVQAPIIDLRQLGDNFCWGECFGGRHRSGALLLLAGNGMEFCFIPVAACVLNAR